MMESILLRIMLIIVCALAPFAGFFIWRKVRKGKLKVLLRYLLYSVTLLCSIQIIRNVTVIYAPSALLNLQIYYTSLQILADMFAIYAAYGFYKYASALSFKK